MTLKQFIQLLTELPEQNLSFKLANSNSIAPHFHLTEIKHQIINSIDCGGKQDQWEEVVLQLWSYNETDDKHRLSSKKLLAIAQKTIDGMSINLNLPIKVEYQIPNSSTSLFQLTKDTHTPQEASFILEPLDTQCKASDTGCCNSSTACCG